MRPTDTGMMTLLELSSINYAINFLAPKSPMTRFQWWSDSDNAVKIWGKGRSRSANGWLDLLINDMHIVLTYYQSSLRILHFRSEDNYADQPSHDYDSLHQLFFCGPQDNCGQGKMPTLPSMGRAQMDMGIAGSMEVSPPRGLGEPPMGRFIQPPWGVDSCAPGPSSCPEGNAYLAMLLAMSMKYNVMYHLLLHSKF